MRYFPIFLDLQDKPVLVAGGGDKAAQKLRLLVKSPARIVVVAETVSAEVARLAEAADIELRERPFTASDLDKIALVFSADDDPSVDAAVAEAARARAIPVNVVDGPADSSFIMPAIVDRSPVVLAIGTEGTAPVLARDLRARIEAMLPAKLGTVARRAGALRRRLHAEIADGRTRRRVWERLLTGAWRGHVLANDETAASAELERQIAEAGDGGLTRGRVTLIGCGPGDPELLTLKAQARMQEADVLVVDRLVHPSILEHARRDAVRIFAGKEPDGPSTTQDEINRLLISEAMKGNRVARLKGGDAFVFGRAAEEMTALRAAGIEVDVVPGITAAHACAASVGLPVTMRKAIRQFTVATGASADGAPDLDWAALSRPRQAAAIYMGVRSAPVLRDRLIEAGARPALPVVIVENGTRPEERVIATTLDLLPEAIEAKQVRGPAILFLGLSWEAACLSRPAHVESYERGFEQVEASERNWTPAEIGSATHEVAG